MARYTYLVLTFLFGTALCAPSPSESKRYRSDYQYNERTDAYYKLHIEARPKWDVKNVCDAEGASLMVPGTHEDIIQAHSMFKRYPDLGEYLWVASDGHDHVSAEETVIINLTELDDDGNMYNDPHKGRKCDGLTRSGHIVELECYRQRPFVCKVDAKNVPFDPQCNVFGNDYQYNATLGSCYSVRRWAASWNEAYSECRSEGAHLVVLNSEAEKDVVHALIEVAPYVQGSSHHLYYFAGFRANKTVGNESSIYRTIFNESLAEAGFAVWSPGEPNNLYNQELCGSLIKSDGLLNDINCEQKYPFVCEKEVAAKS